MKTKITRKEFLTKMFISATLLLLMFLSFLFASELEHVFKMKTKYAKNEVSAEQLKNSSYFVDYIDVGQGNSSLIVLPDEKTVLVDGGNIMYGEVVADHLLSRGVTSIDYMIATHADSDHIGGLNYILENFEVKNVFRPFQIAGSGTSAETFEVYEYEDLGIVYENFASESSRNKISRVTSDVYKDFIKNIYTETFSLNGETISSEVTVFYDGLKISGINYEIEFFAPLVRDETVDLSLTTNTKGYATKGYGVTKSNDNSAVFLLTCVGNKFLFTGDASWKEGLSNEVKWGKFEELDFISSLSAEEKAKLSDVAVYIAGHHGSSHSSSSQLLEIINPKFMVFSVGSNNNYGHPASEVIFRIEKTQNLEKDYLLRTDYVGNISFGEVDGNLRYSLQISQVNENYSLSWQLFVSIIVGCLIVLVVFTKPKSRKI